MKMCKRCETLKPETAFQDREDSWGLYDWCNDCCMKEGRNKLTPKQQLYISKTQLFFLREEYVGQL